MGSIIQNIANNITTSGVFTSSAITNTSISAVTALPAAVPTGNMAKISTQTASSSAQLEFTSGINSTYSTYLFLMSNLNPATDINKFRFQTSTNGGSSYGVSLTSSNSVAYNKSDGTDGAGPSITADDQGNGSSNQIISGSVGNGADEALNGEFWLFDPSNNSKVKHFICKTVYHQNNEYVEYNFTSGYFNTTTAINAMKFLFSSGNIDEGNITLYGIT